MAHGLPSSDETTTVTGNDLYPFGSQDTQPGDLDHGPATNGLRKAPILERVHAVLACIKANDLSLVSFSHVSFLF